MAFSQRSILWAVAGGTLLIAQSPLESLANSGSSGFGTPVFFPGALNGGIYDTRGELAKLPDFRQTLRLGTIYSNALNISPRPFSEGFPGLVPPWGPFALEFKGAFRIDEAGEYRFSLSSIDGSRLLIDDKLAIDNDGVHEFSEKQISLPLLRGLHQIRVSYFHRAPKPVALILRIAKGDTGDWRIFDTNEFGDRAAAVPEPEQMDSLDPPPASVRYRPNPDNSRLKLDEALQQNPAALAALAANPKPHQFDFRIATYQFRNSDPLWQGTLVVEIPPGIINVNAENQVQAAVLALVRDENGTVFDRLVFDGPRDATAGVPLTWTHPLLLDPKVYNVDVAVVAKDSGQVSTASTKINPGATPAGLSMSDLLLVRRFEEGPVRRNDPLVHLRRRVIPQLDEHYSIHSHPAVFFTVYPSASSLDKVVMEIEYRVNGKLLGRKTSEIARVRTGMAFALEPKVHEGNCEMRVLITQGSQSVKGAARFVVDGK